MKETTGRLPLKVSKFSDGETTAIEYADGETLCLIQHEDSESAIKEADKDATLIVTAVNCHDELVEACDFLLDGLDECWEVDHRDQINKLRTVLSRAKGEL